jgi:LmbE family N-acetylglucosaminyl deacetylase
VLDEALDVGFSRRGRRPPGMIVLFAALLFIVLLWGGAVLFATELGVPTRDVTPFRRVLAVFPHGDDEAVNCGGTLHRLSASGAAVTLVLLTRGERGTPDGTPSRVLAEVRVDEARRGAGILGVSELAQEDFGDGRVRNRTSDVAAFLDQTIARVRPDLVITYDRAGLYGHDDHVACSDVLTELMQTRFPDVALWYVALPRRLQAWVKLDESLRQRRLAPTHRAFIGTHLLAKTRALLAYRSQREPTWFVLSMLPFEHFASPANGDARRHAHPSSRTRRNAPR